MGRTVKEEKAVSVLETNTIQAITEMTPAAVVGMSTKQEIAETVLPEEFQGQELETLDSGFAPTVKWVSPGNFVGGVYLGFENGVGPNNSRLYQFKIGDKDFGIWGTLALDRLMDEGISKGVIQPGRKMLVIYMGSVETDKQPCKLFQVKVLKPK